MSGRGRQGKAEEGPALEELLRRLAECPAEFLQAPRQGSLGTVHVDAVVTDLMVDLGCEIPSQRETAPYRKRGADNRNHLRQVLVACWLLHAPCFRGLGDVGPAVKRFFETDLRRLSKLVAAELLVNDPDRREELVRLALRALGLRPRGESRSQAEDRLERLDSVRRDKLIREARERQERARRLREQMRKEEARRAAARYTRE